MRALLRLWCRWMGHDIPDAPGNYICRRCRAKVYVVGPMDDVVFSASPLFGKVRQ